MPCVDYLEQLERNPTTGQLREQDVPEELMERSSTRSAPFTANTTDRPHYGRAPAPTRNPATELAPLAHV